VETLGHGWAVVSSVVRFFIGSHGATVAEHLPASHHPANQALPRPHEKPWLFGRRIIYSSRSCKGDLLIFFWQIFLFICEQFPCLICFQVKHSAQFHRDEDNTHELE
jgi:hypothetical protein